MINGLLRTTSFDNRGIGQLLCDERISFVSISAKVPDYAIWVKRTLEPLVPEDGLEERLANGEICEAEFRAAYREQLQRLGPETVAEALSVGYGDVLVIVAGQRREDGVQRHVLASWVNGRVGREIVQEL